MIMANRTFQQVCVGWNQVPAVTLVVPTELTRREGLTGESSRDNALFDRLATWEPSTSTPVLVRLGKAELPREMSAGDVGELDARLRGCAVLARRNVEERPLHEHHLITGEERDGTRWLCRSKLIKSGGEVYRLDALVPLDSAPKLAETCSVIATSLTLQGKQPVGFAEPLATHRFHGLRCAFEYPSSWQIAVDHHEDALQACRLTDPESQCHDERIGVAVFRKSDSKSTPSRIARQFASNLARDGYRLSGAVLLPIALPGTERAFAYCPSARQENATASVGATILERGEYRIAVTVRGVGRGICPATMAITRRAAQIVRDSLAAGS